MKEKCDFPAFTGHRLDDDMIHIEFKKIKKLTAEDVGQIFDCHEKVGSGKKVYVLVTFSGFIPMSNDAMEEAKKQNKRNTNAATAYVVGNVALRLGINFFMNFYKPKHPIHIAKTKSAGLNWLYAQKKEAKK